MISDGLPIGEKGLRRTQFEVMGMYDRAMTLDCWPVIEEVRQTGKVRRQPGSEPLFRRLLESRAILLYRNSVEWYGLNPAVAELQPPPVSAP